MAVSAGFHLVRQTNLKAHKDLINYLFLLAENPSNKNIDAATLTTLLFSSMETLLRDSATSYSGLIEQTMTAIREETRPIEMQKPAFAISITEFSEKQPLTEKEQANQQVCRCKIYKKH